MLVMLLIGWIVLLPAIVVAGLYIGSSVLSRRRAALQAYEDLFADDEALDPLPGHASAYPRTEPAAPTPLRPDTRGADRPAAVDETPPVAARF
ncbi:MAG TPA: hypothetical protein VKV21_18565 [Solirubrobacteraceae bacterium]|nr:hypothetical protein [Solirubrobacteraceae bacterium]